MIDRGGMAERVKSYRLENSFSQEGLARICGISHMTIQKVEKGKYIMDDMVQKIASGMGVSPMWLMTGKHRMRCRKRNQEWKVEPNRKRIICPYCGKVIGWTMKDLRRDEMPMPGWCCWCGGKVQINEVE